MILERATDPFRHRAAEVFRDDAAGGRRPHGPKLLADQVVARRTEHPLGGGVDVGEAPVLIERQKPVIDTGEDPLGAIPRGLRFTAQVIFDMHRLPPQRGHVKIGAHPRQQLAGTEGFDQIVVGAGGQSLDFGFLSGPRR